MYCFSNMELAWQTTMLIVASSGRGKTSLTRAIVRERNKIFNVNSRMVLWCYNAIESVPPDLQRGDDVVLHQGLPSMEEVRQYKTLKPLIVIDDLMVEMKSSSEMEKLVSVATHHYDCQLIILLHTVFYGATIRNLRLQASYVILFKNPNDKQSVICMGNQIMARNSKTFLEIYDEATKEPYSYLLIDLYKECPDVLRFRNNVLPGQLTYVYVPKS